MPSTETESHSYQHKYRNLKRKLKILIYENECFQEELKKAQRKLLKVSRDKSFLLDRLLRYETVESSTSDSDATVSSDSDNEFRAELMTIKKKRTSVNTENQDATTSNSLNNAMTSDTKKKKSRKTCPVKPEMLPIHAIKDQHISTIVVQQNQPNMMIDTIVVSHGDGHMTSEEIERHLEAKQTLRDLIPEKTPLTVPVEMFSNDPSGID